jgi:oligopeptide transport system substrate-binding protein
MSDKLTDKQTAIVSGDEVFTHSAGRRLALYAAYAIAGLAAFIYVLNLAIGGTGSTGSTGAIDVENNSITIALRQEPPELDAGRATDAISHIVLAHVMEGLIAYDIDDNLTPGVAERWEIREDGATFWLREDSLWNDGVPVTAADFVFAWRRVVDPASASQYSFIMFPVKNAEAITNGELPPETLGVRAISDRILEVDFEQPTPYFEKLAAFLTYYPMRQDFFESTNGRYGADPDMMLYNGPYTVTEWVHGSTMRWVKNPLYWNDEKGFLDEIHTAYITEDVNAKLNLFKDGQIVDTHLMSPMLPEAMEKRWQIDRSMDGTVFFLEFNHRQERITHNRNFRRAMQLAQDPAELVYKALKEPSYLPAVSLFPAWLKGVSASFLEEYPPVKHQMNLVRAREHLELARQELGIGEFPPLMLLTDSSPIGMLSAEYYQQLFLKNLGLEVRIDPQIFKQRLEKMRQGEFDLVMGGWGPDYNDVLTFGDLFSSWNLQNRGRYKSDEMDSWVRIAQSELDPRKRMDAFGEIQRLLYEDVVILPQYERGFSFVVDPRLKDFKRRSVGPEVDYNYAYIDGTKNSK